jgi:hypothetical protein
VRLTVRVLGLTLLDLEISDTDDEADEPPPRTFGFHGSGPGLVELDDKDDRSLDSIETYSRRR